MAEYIGNDVKNVFVGTLGNDIIRGLAGNDTLNGAGGNDLLVGNKGSDYLYGDVGSDTLYGNEDNDLLSGGSGDDLLDGGTGSDTITGGEGQDSLYGGTGADWIIIDGMDIADGGNDVDMLDARNDMSGMTVSLNNNDVDYHWRNFENFLGGSGADSVKATNGANRIETGAEADTIDGGGGRDTVLAGAGDDVVAYYSGVSLADGGLGVDIVNAQNYSKGLSINVATDTKYKNFEGVIGTSFGDTLTGGKENNWFNGGAGNDILDGGGGNDELFGQTGNDTYVFGLAKGNDVVGEIGNDAGDKLIIASGFGVDTDIWSSGNDLVIALNSNDHLTLCDWFEDEAAMIEKVQIGTKVTNSYNMGINAGNIAAETGKNFFIGTAVEDVMTGTGLGNDADIAFGLDGNDVLSGGNGADMLFGGSGNDWLLGGNDADTLVGGTGDDTLLGGNGVDRLVGGSGNDILIYDGADSLIDGGKDFDILTAAETTARVIIDLTKLKFKGIEQLIGSNYGDTLKVSTTLATVYGGAGDDVITGGNGDDFLNGEAGRDRLTGGAGNDYLSGGAGNDTLTGGLGNDTYVIELALGNDVIMAAAAAGNGNDVVLIGNNDCYSFDIGIQKKNNDLLLVITPEQTITLKDWFKGITANRINRFTFTDGTYAINADSLSFIIEGALSGTAGNDSVVGTTGNEQIFAYGGNDFLDGGAGVDVLSGGYGNDTLVFDSKDTLVSGGFGNDMLLVAVDALGTEVELDNYQDIENVTGAQGNDSLYGNSLNNILAGGVGNDILAGGSGSDTYIFGLGLGNDTVVASTSNYIDSICFADGLMPGDLLGTVVGNDLIVSVVATGETLTIAGWSDSIGNKLNQFIIDNETYRWDGSTWKSASGLRGVLAYVSDQGGNDNIYSTQSNDSHAVALTTDANDEYSPVWSPDGSHMAYVLGPDWNSFVYVMNDDGTGKTDLTPSYGNTNIEPVWSPGGYKIVFNHQGSWMSWSDLYMLSTDGTGYGQNITNTLPAEYDAAWSPDGTKIAYGAWDGYWYSIFTFDILSGQTNKLALSGGNGNYGYLSWSPDGSKLACVDTGSNQIIVVNADGSGEQQLTVPGFNEVNRNPVWSPDGTKIAYEWGVKNPSTLSVTNWEIMIMDVDGSNKTKLTTNSADDCNPVWSPDGTQLAFETFRNGNWDIYYMDSNGTNQIRVTFSDGNDTNPVWQSQSAFSVINVVEGTSGADASLEGAEGSDIIYGFEGADSIYGFDGNDTIFGGIGDDTVDGGNGNDLLFSGGSYLHGGEILQGGNGNDTLIVEANCSGSYNLVGGAGSDVYQVTLHELYGVPVITAAADNSDDTLVITQASTARIWIEQSGNDLHLTNSNSFSEMYLKDWYKGSGYQLQNFRFGDAMYGISGGEWVLTQVLVGNDDGHNTKATALAIASGCDIVEGLDFAGDCDWFTYTPTENGTYNLYLSAGNTPLFIDILDGNGQQINDWRGEPNSLQDGFVANAKMEVGKSYYIRIVGQDPQQRGAYNIQFVKQTPTDGDDKLHGSAGDDYIDALGGNDTIVHWYASMFEDGRDTLLGGDGNDVIIMGGTCLYVDGGNDNDSVSGYMSGSTVYGGAGDDNLSGVYGSDNTIDGGSGNDNMGGDTSGCLYSGGAGNDTLGFWNSASYNTLIGGEGNDVYSIREGGRGGVNHNIINNFAENGTNDTDIADFSYDFRKNDFVYNAEAGDLVMYRYRSGSLQEFLRFTQWFAGNEYQVDSFVFHSYEDGGTLSASDIIARTGLNTSGSIGEGNDLVYGNSVENLLNGLGGNDQIYGFDGNDTLSGNDGIDYLAGGNGNDRLFDGAGNDVLAGGYGADTFVWSGEGYADVIEDYGLGDQLVMGAGITFEMLDDAGYYAGHEVYLSGTELVFNLGANNLHIKNGYQGEGTSCIVNFDDGSQHTLNGNTTTLWWG